MFLLTALFFVPAGLYAQAPSLKADIPFDFFGGDTVLTAGTYTIGPMDMLRDAVLLHSADSETAMFIVPCTHALDRTDHDSRLVFQGYGGQYYLWQIWTEDYDQGRQLCVERAETDEEKVAQPYTFATKATFIEP